MMKTCLLAATLCAVLATAASAQGFPNRPIRIVVPYPAGGTTDAMARVLQEPLQKLLGQQVLIDNKAGASGAIGSREVARAPADGYTLLFSNNGPSSTTPLLVKSAGYDGVKDFAPVSQVSSAPLFLMVHAGVPVDDLKGFVDHVRKLPQGIEYGSGGIGSLGHLAMEWFAQATKLKLVHVPYKGQAPASTALVSGEVKVTLTTTSSSMTGFVKEGKLKLLAITTAQPSPLAPGSPSMNTVLPGYDVGIWFGLLAPVGTPAGVVARLNEAVAKTLQQPDVQERFRSFGVLATPSTPTALGALVASEVTRWAEVVRLADIKAE
jgi:tripartite-type tricarboxylate transporter receptor subunit TctC